MPYIYHEHILTHARSPQNRGRLALPTFLERATNASCGDALEMSGEVDQTGRLQRCMFDGAGCALSQASASLLTDWVKGKSTKEILALSEADVMSWLGIDPGPLRMRCAALPLLALQQGLRVWKKV